MRRDRIDELRQWIEKKIGLPSSCQILMTPRGTNVRANVLSNEVRLFSTGRCNRLTAPTRENCFSTIGRSSNSAPSLWPTPYRRFQVSLPSPMISSRRPT